MLTEKQCEAVENALTNDVEPRKLAAYLCLHMGLTLAEASAVRLEDIDLENGMLTVRNTLTRVPDTPGRGRYYEMAPASVVRTVPMPPHVLRLIRNNTKFYDNEKCFLVNGETSIPRAHYLQNLLVSINDKHHLTETVSAGMLREVFIRRCLESGLDLYTISVFVGVKQLADMQKKYGQYLQAYINKIDRLERYTPDYVPSVLPSEDGKHMNLLILGAGSQGAVVKEIAEETRLFNKIDFLDDDPNNPLAIDTCTSFARYTERYPIAIPSFGNCELREKWADALQKSGFILPIIIHPSATISNQVSIADGVVIEAKAIIGNGVTIERNCIISAGAVLDKGCTVKANVHVGCACTIMKNAVVPEGTRIPAGVTFGKDNLPITPVGEYSFDDVM